MDKDKDKEKTSPRNSAAAAQTGLELFNSVLGLAASMTVATDTAYAISKSGRKVYTYNIAFVNTTESMITVESYSADSSFVSDMPAIVYPESDAELNWLSKNTSKAQLTVNCKIAGVPFSIFLSNKSPILTIQVNNNGNSSDFYLDSPISPVVFSFAKYKVTFTQISNKGGNIALYFEEVSPSRAIPALLPVAINTASLLLTSGSVMASIADTIMKGESKPVYTYHIKFINTADVPVSFTSCSLSGKHGYLAQYPSVVFPDSAEEFVWIATQGNQISLELDIIAGTGLRITNSSSHDLLSLQFYPSYDNPDIPYISYPGNPNISYPAAIQALATNDFNITYITVSATGGTVEFLIKSV